MKRNAPIDYSEWDNEEIERAYTERTGCAYDDYNAAEETIAMSPEQRAHYLVTGNYRK